MVGCPSLREIKGKMKGGEMAKVKMIRSGMTINRKVRLQGEVFELPKHLPISMEKQIKYFRKGKAWYVEVDSQEERVVAAMGGMPIERDAFTTDQVISPGFAASDDTPSDVKVEQVGPQPTDKEIEDSMELKSNSTAIATDEEVEDEEGEEDEISLQEMTREELRGIIDDEGLDVEFDTKTTKGALISGIEEAREE